MLKNKKGLDYAAMMVLVSLIVVVYMYIQLSAILEGFQVNIGESQIALLNAYQQGENTLLYVDQAAKFSAYRALDSVARTGGVATSDCGTLEGQGSAIAAWTAKGKNCLGAVRPYDVFAAAFNKDMNAYLVQYKNALLPQDNYELLVQKDSVTGTAVSSAVVAVRPPPETIAATLGAFTIPFTTQKLIKTSIGEYAFKPSFTVPVAAKLDVYDSLKRAVEALYVCADTKSFDECVDTLKPPFTLARSAINPEYVIATAKNPAKSPFGTLADITFALYAPQQQPTSTPAPEQAPPAGG